MVVVGRCECADYVDLKISSVTLSLREECVKALHPTFFLTTWLQKRTAAFDPEPPAPTSDGLKVRRFISKREHHRPAPVLQPTRGLQNRETIDADPHPRPPERPRSNCNARKVSAFGWVCRCCVRWRPLQNDDSRSEVWLRRYGHGGSVRFCSAGS